MVDPLTLAVAALCVFIISFTKGAFGGGFAIIGIPLLALVMAFAGVDRTLELYRVAIEERYRFYSFGDAMLVL